MEMGSKQPQDKAVSGQQRSGGGDRGRHKEEKRNKTDSISAHGARPLTRPSLRRRSGLPGATLAPTRSGTPVDRIFGKSTFGTLCQLRPPAPHAPSPSSLVPSMHSASWRSPPRPAATGLGLLPRGPGLSGGQGWHLVSWIHWWNALACWANSWRSLSFSSCRRCSFCSSSSLS